MAERITSAQNPKIKQLLALQQKSSLRRETGLFVVEGRREIRHCLEAGFGIDTLFVCPEIISSETSETDSFFSSTTADTACSSGKTMSTLGHVRGRGPADTSSEGAQETLERMERNGSFAEELADRPAGAMDFRIFHLSPEVYSKVAYREGTEGMIAQMKARHTGLEDLKLKKNPLIAVLESVEKPGNLGAVLRSADAAGADAVIVCDPLTDIFNPNLIRASIGAVFTVPTVCCSSEQAIEWLKHNNIKIFTAQLQDSHWYYDTDLKQGSAIVMGTESTGLSQVWRDAADAHIKIPMLGKLDSLNVSVSAAILLFEAVRQRNG